MNKLRKIMEGRYGGDQLSVAFLLLGILFSFIGRLARIPLLSSIAFVPLLISIFRIFSKDISKRSMENYKFAILISPIYSRYKRSIQAIKSRKTYKHFKCPNCKSKLRLPKGKGRVMITCPRCKERFERRT